MGFKVTASDQRQSAIAGHSINNHALFDLGEPHDLMGVDTLILDFMFRNRLTALNKAPINTLGNGHAMIYETRDTRGNMMFIAVVGVNDER